MVFHSLPILNKLLIVFTPSVCSVSSPREPQQVSDQQMAPMSPILLLLVSILSQPCLPKSMLATLNSPLNLTIFVLFLVVIHLLLHLLFLLVSVVFNLSPILILLLHQQPSSLVLVPVWHWLVLLLLLSWFGNVAKLGLLIPTLRWMISLSLNKPKSTSLLRDLTSLAMFSFRLHL